MASYYKKSKKTEAPKLHVKTGDTVVIISGKDKGHTGKVAKAFPREGRIVVEGAAMVKRHQKPRGQGMPGGIIDMEAPIRACKAMLVCPSCKKATRAARGFVEDPDRGKPRKIRSCRKCGAAIDG